MPSPESRARLAASGVAVFWLATLLGGALAPGYSARADYVSSLAGRGSEVAALGVTALAVLGLAHLVAASVTPAPVAVPLALAGLAGLTVAGFRISCPHGAAGCSFGPDAAPPDLPGTVHGLAVGAYEVALVAAMLVVAARLARSRPAAAATTLLAAVASVLLVGQLGGEANGLWQRGWLVVNTGWLLVTVLRLPRHHLP